jgi:hypothetical protein
MTNAKHDANARPTIICLSNIDGATTIPLLANGGLNVSDGTTGSNVGNNGGNAMIDENSVSTWTALSSAGDGSIVNVYADGITQRLLINSL